MRDLSAYSDHDLEQVAREALRTYAQRGRPVLLDEAADCLAELRRRCRLLDGTKDWKGASTRYRAAVARIYDGAADDPAWRQRYGDLLQRRVSTRITQMKENAS